MQTNDVPDRLLNNTAAAQLLSISPRQLVHMRDRGEVPYVKVLDHARGTRYSEKALTAWIAARQKQSPRSPAPAARKKGNT